jgi:hypothetical protein
MLAKLECSSSVVATLRREACQLTILLMLLCLPTQASGHPGLTSQLVELLAATAQASRAAGVQDHTLEQVVAGFPEGSANWPVALFVAAEINRLKDQHGRARDQYRMLAQWGAEDAINGGWGGSSLATFALWRWLTLLEVQPPSYSAEVKKAIEVAKDLKASRFNKGIFYGPSTALPRLEEDISRRLAKLPGRLDYGKRQSVSLSISWDLRIPR